LKREPEKVSKSYIERWYVRGSIIRAFYGGVLMRENAPSSEEKSMCGSLLVRTMEDNIEFFLNGKKNWVSVRVENLEDDFFNFVSKAALNIDRASAERELRSVTNKNRSFFEKLSIKRFLVKFKRFISF